MDNATKERYRNNPELNKIVQNMRSKNYSDQEMTYVMRRWIVEKENARRQAIARQKAAEAQAKADAEHAEKVQAEKDDMGIRTYIDEDGVETEVMIGEDNKWYQLEDDGNLKKVGFESDFEKDLDKYFEDKGEGRKRERKKVKTITSNLTGSKKQNEVQATLEKRYGNLGFKFEGYEEGWGIHGHKDWIRITAANGKSKSFRIDNRKWTGQEDEDKDSKNAARMTEFIKENADWSGRGGEYTYETGLTGHGKGEAVKGRSKNHLMKVGNSYEVKGELTGRDGAMKRAELQPVARL